MKEKSSALNYFELFKFSQTTQSYAEALVSIVILF